MNTLRVTDRDDLTSSLAAAGVPIGGPVVVVIGSASRMSDEEISRGRTWFDQGLVPAVVATAATVVDGGTDSGVMRLTGLARRTSGGSFPLVGVTAEGTVEASDGDDDQRGRAPLEPNHTLAVLVPGASWGDESPWITLVAQAIADGGRVVGLLVKGGRIAELDAGHLLAANLPLVVLMGWGGAADRFAPPDLPQRPGVVVVDPSDGPGGLAMTLEGMLRPSEA
jgi:SLOG in TRPM, prokaryote